WWRARSSYAPIHRKKAPTRDLSSAVPARLISTSTNCLPLAALPRRLARACGLALGRWESGLAEPPVPLATGESRAGHRPGWQRPGRTGRVLGLQPGKVLPSRLKTSLLISRVCEYKTSVDLRAFYLPDLNRIIKHIFVAAVAIKSGGHLMSRHSRILTRKA